MANGGPTAAACSQRITAPTRRLQFGWNHLRINGHHHFMPPGTLVTRTAWMFRSVGEKWESSFLRCRCARSSVIRQAYRSRRENSASTACHSGGSDCWAKMWLEKLAKVDQERRGYLRLAGNGHLSDEELDALLAEP